MLVSVGALVSVTLSVGFDELSDELSKTELSSLEEDVADETALDAVEEPLAVELF